MCAPEANLAGGNLSTSREGIGSWRKVKWQNAVQQPQKQFAGTPYGKLSTATTVNGRGCVAAPKIVGPEDVILAGFWQNPGLRFLGFLADEAEAMVKERPRWIRLLPMDP